MIKALCFLKRSSLEECWTSTLFLKVPSAKGTFLLGIHWYCNFKISYTGKIFCHLIKLTTATLLWSHFNTKPDKRTSFKKDIQLNKICSPVSLGSTSKSQSNRIESFPSWFSSYTLGTATFFILTASLAKWYHHYDCVIALSEWKREKLNSYNL